MDIIAVEQALTAWIAEKLGVAVDNGIYRGGIPEGYESGIAVVLGTEIKDTDIRAKTYNVQVFGKYADRDSALVLISKLSGIVPAWGIVKDSITFRAVLPRGGAAPFAGNDDGQTRFFASVNLIVVVLTSGAQI